jgi:phosphatidylglycerophosphatase A
MAALDPVPKRSAPGAASPRVSLARLIAAGFGSGLFPVAPGTAGTFAALLLGIGLLHLSPYALPAATILAIFSGVWAIRAAGVAREDPGWVVIDEFAGQWIAMLPLAVAPIAAATPGALAVSFVLFRILDVTKLGPIGWADRSKTPWGVMGDDVLAGAGAAILLWAAMRFFPGLLG